MLTVPLTLLFRALPAQQLRTQRTERWRRHTYVLLPGLRSGGVPESVTVAVLA